MSDVSTETVAPEYVRVEAPNAHLVVRLPDGSMLALHGQRMRVLQRNEFGILARPEPWNFDESAWPNAWWLDFGRFRVE